MTEKLLTGTLSLNTTNQPTTHVCTILSENSGSLQYFKVCVLSKWPITCFFFIWHYLDFLSNCIYCSNFIGRSSTGCVGSHYLEIYSSITHKIWEVYNCTRKYKTWITSFIKVTIKLRKLVLFLMFMKHSRLLEIIPGFRARLFPWPAAWEISGTWSPLDSVNHVCTI